MFTFIKKLFGFDKETMQNAGVQIEQVPYKVEPNPVNPQCSDSVTQPDGNECKTFPTAVNDQITDAVTQHNTPSKKPVQGQKKPAAKKVQGQKKPATVKQPTSSKPNTGPRRGRKPKAKPVVK